MTGRLLFIGLALLTSAVVAGEPYVPRTRVHIKCHFADGTYVEYKKREKFYFASKLHPHAQTTGPLDGKMSYVDGQGQRHEGIGTTRLDCLGVGKRDGKLFWHGGFEDDNNRRVELAFSPVRPDQVPVEAIPRASEAAHLQAELAELKAKKIAHTVHNGMVISLGNRRLVLEEPLTTIRHPDYPRDTVLYVLQSLSNDFGRTWTKPVLTTDAKLFDIGQPMRQQSWAPRLEVIVLDSSMRPAQ